VVEARGTPVGTARALSQRDRWAKFREGHDVTTGMARPPERGAPRPRRACARSSTFTSLIFSSMILAVLTLALAGTS
jgi:hypothetical protein